MQLNIDISKYQFHEIPQEFRSLINQIKDLTLKKIYDNTEFLYVDYSAFSNKETNQDQAIISNYLFNYLSQFFFFTYYFTSFVDDDILNPKENPISAYINVVICVEGKCLIIKSINKIIFLNIIQSMRIFSINCNEISNESSEIKEEIKNFSKYFLQNERNKEKIKKNNEIFLQKERKINFIQFSIRPICCFLIRRFFLPSNFFKDPSFFIFEQERQTNEQKFNSKLDEFIKGRKMNEIEFKNFISETEKLFQEDEINKNDNYNRFQENDFVELRVINGLYSIVFHSKSLHLFTMKKMNYDLNEKSVMREIDFCMKNKNRFFVKCYGFIEINGRIDKIIYKLMCNGSLMTRANQMNEFYLIQLIIRLFEGINYLHSNSMVHRDLKPSNILFDNDFQACISDFETIRFIDVNNKKNDNDFTYDFGSNEFASPEHIQGKPISFSTDIYSFGKIIEFIVKKNQSCYYFIETIQYLSNIFKICIQKDPEERVSLDQIKNCLISFNEFFYNHNLNYFYMLFNNFRQIELYHFFYENLAFSLKYQKNEPIKIIFINYITLCKNCYRSTNELCAGTLFYIGVNFLSMNNLNKAIEFFDLAAKYNNSNVLCKLGNLYLNGEGIKPDLNKAKEYFEEAAKDNNSDALNSLGFLYYYGKGVNQDYSKAKEYYEEAIKQNNANALYNLGNLYYKGQGVEQDFLKAKNYFDLSAQQFNSDAINGLGNLYFYGYGVEQDYDKAFYYYNLSAQQSNPAALVNLGGLYLRGQSVEINYQKAFECYELAAQQNNPEAIFNLALLYLDKQNYGKAKEYFEAAAKRENSHALNRLGDLYLYGQGVEINYQKAKDFYEQALKMNNFEAYNNLGILYLNGKGVEQDYTKAREYFEKGAEHKNLNSLVNLGSIYLNGQGIEKDLNKAKELYEEAAKNDSAEAYHSLGNMYLNGSGVDQDFVKARNYFELAIKQNYLDSLVNLGNIYLNGQGVDKNFAKAKKYFELAASRNNIEALNSLGFIYLHGYGVEKDYQEAKRYFELASKNNNSNALSNLGYMYYNGFGVEQDYIKAKEYFEKSASLNNSYANISLGDLYIEGNGVEQNSSKAIEYYKKALTLNDYRSYYSLGRIYYTGYQGIVKDYLRARYYFELAAKYKNVEAIYCLFIMYISGEGVQEDPKKANEYLEQYLSLCDEDKKANTLCFIGLLYLDGHGYEKDYFKARSYLEMASEKNFSFATYYLALIYWNGLGVEKDYSKSRYYFELANNQGNPDSLFYLGYIYENGKGVQIDLEKSINYYLKCSKIQNVESLPDNSKYYRSNNDLGLIYLLEKDYQNLELAKEFIKIAGLNEYQFGQNNLAILFQYFLNSKDDTEHLLLKATKNKFVLAEFNLANFFEEEKKIEKAFQFFESASNNEDEPFTFMKDVIDDDERLEVSKTFVILYTNLKLTKKFFSEKKVEKAKKFFLRAIFKPLFKFLFLARNKSYSFVFKIENRKPINLKNFFFNFPLFNLQNQDHKNEDIYQTSDWSINESSSNNSIELIIQNIDDNIDEIINMNQKFIRSQENDLNNENELNTNFDNEIEDIFNNMNNQKQFVLLNKQNENGQFQEFRFKSSKNSIESSLKYPKKLYNLIFENLSEIQSDIDDIINLLRSFLYTPPYPILFGRIKLKTESEKPNIVAPKDINDSFYDGLNL